MRSVALITLTWRKPISLESFREFLKHCQDKEKGEIRTAYRYCLILFIHVLFLLNAIVWHSNILFHILFFNAIVCSMSSVACIRKYCGRVTGLTYIFNQHVVSLMRLFQRRSDEIRDGSSSAGSGSDEEHHPASARVQLTCKQCGFIQRQPRQVDVTPAMCTQTHQALNTNQQDILKFFILSSWMF